ncbi:hypothetical protein RFI_25284, partial [Reticulomyxa filosa]
MQVNVVRKKILKNLIFHNYQKLKNSLQQYLVNVPTIATYFFFCCSRLNCCFGRVKPKIKEKGLSMLSCLFMFVVEFFFGDVPHCKTKCALFPNEGHVKNDQIFKGSITKKKCFKHINEFVGLFCFVLFSHVLKNNFFYTPFWYTRAKFLKLSGNRISKIPEECVLITAQFKKKKKKWTSAKWGKKKKKKKKINCNSKFIFPHSYLELTTSAMDENSAADNHRASNKSGHYSERKSRKRNEVNDSASRGDGDPLFRIEPSCLHNTEQRNRTIEANKHYGDSHFQSI